jgi:hypothetical protein
MYVGFPSKKFMATHRAFLGDFGEGGKIGQNGKGIL